jgi:hypothetical protein
MPPSSLQDVTGFRGEKIVELCLTDYSAFSRPLFQPGFLGDKWPAVDFYVELNGVRGRRPFFLIQSKATSADLAPNATSLRISTTKGDIVRLLEIPGPTYILGVHEPSRRVFAKSVHTGIAVRAITRIQLTHELTSGNLQRLYDEVRGYWRTTGHKPRCLHERGNFQKRFDRTSRRTLGRVILPGTRPAFYLATHVGRSRI